MLNKVARVDTLVLFLVLAFRFQERLSDFHHWVWCHLWFCHIWPLLCCTRFPLCPFSGKYHKWVFNFIKIIFCFYWHDHMVFILQFVNVMLSHSLICRYWKVLASWNKSHLIMVYHPFNVLLDSVWIHILLRTFTLCSSVILAYNFFFDIFFWFWYQGVGGLIEWVWECSLPCSFLE